jgi:transketolase
MGMADLAEVLWRDYLNHNPGNPQWADRDRFVLSTIHGSMLIYSLLHLTGYDLPIEELKAFPPVAFPHAGSPGSGLHRGVETTTGPLGQGIANAVGWQWQKRRWRPSSTALGMTLSITIPTRLWVMAA